ncbi:hypothetical protein [Massilia sp. DWR3-1-1]|uniref:hypothetical protein n=1 Tax=Massilia sp. DWR3-1-1 TaxID=2804559 RepID=UPI003CE97846
MSMKHVFSVCVLMVLAVAACSKKDLTPDEVVKGFLTDFSEENIDGAVSRLGPTLKARFLDKPDVTKSAFKEQKVKVEKCGGYKTISANYTVTPEQSTVEGYSLINFKGQCPGEKQYVRLTRSEGRWLIDEFGPTVKQ